MPAAVPAVFAVTRDRFIAFSSNALAVLGLRALYFLVMGAMGRLRYLDRGLAVVLGFVGIKMMISDLYHIPIWISLGAVIGILAIAVVVSLLAGPDLVVEEERDGASLEAADPPDAPPDATHGAPTTEERRRDAPRTLRP